MTESSTIVMQDTSVIEVSETSTLLVDSTALAQLDGSLQRDATTARFLMLQTFVDVVVGFAASTSAVFVDVTGMSLNFTVPAGRSASIQVSSTLNLLTGAAGTTTYEMIALLDGVAMGTRTAASHIGAAQVTQTKIYQGTAAAGNHTVKMQYRRSGGADTPNVQTGTGLSLQVNW
jgi:hypothetical protein